MRRSLLPVARMNRSLPSAMSAAASNNSGKAIKETMRIRFITDSSYRRKKGRGSAVTPRRDPLALLQVVLMLPVAVLVPVIIVVAVAVDMMHINGDAAVGAAADLLAHRRAISAHDDTERRCLRNEDAVALGVGSHRVRVRPLRDLFDEKIGVRIYHTERRTTGRTASPTPDEACSACPTRSQVVPPIPGVVPNLVRTGNTADVQAINGIFGIDDQRARVGWVVLRSAT